MSASLAAESSVRRSSRRAEARLGGRASRGLLVVEFGLLALLLAIAALQRLVDLEGPRSTFPDLFDEGIRAEQLLLMANGYRPFRDIYSAQGLLLLPLLYPFYALFGGTLGAIRLGVGVISVVGLVGIWWAGRQAAGIAGGLLALFILAASPAYLEASRLALAEVPSLAPAIWAVGCALRWRWGGRARWLYAAVALGTIAVLIKPMAMAVGVPIGLLMLTRPGLRPRHLLIAAALAIGIVAAAVLAMGPTEVYQQIVLYRVGAREGGNWEFRRNLKQVVLEPFGERAGIFILAAASALLLLRADRRTGLALVSWPLAAVLLLLFYYPLHPKHLVYIYPPLALLGGAGLGRATWLAWKDSAEGRHTRLLTVTIAAILTVTPIGALLGRGVAAQNTENDDGDLHVYDDAASRSIELLTGPRKFILTDHPYVAALAQRLVPPNLVDPSRGRTRAGTLTDQDVIEAAHKFDTKLVLTWADRLRRLPGVPPWLDQNYELTHSFGTRNVKNARGAKDRSIYLHRDVDRAAAKSVLVGSLVHRESVDFDGQLRLLGATVSTGSVQPREQLTITLGWEAVATMPSDYHLTLELIDPNGEIRHEQEHDLEGSARGTSTWQPGRWLFRTFALQPESESPAGDYLLRVSIVDPKTGRKLQPVLMPGSAQFQQTQDGWLVLATVRVT